jgi:hypothetical protein
MKDAVLAFEVYRDVKAARRLVRKGLRAAEAFTDKACLYVKRDPFKLVGFTVGMAFGFAAATAWLVSRK